MNIAQIADFNTSSIDRADNNIKLLFDNLDIILGMFISSDINVKILSLTFYPAFWFFNGNDVLHGYLSLYSHYSSDFSNLSCNIFNDDVIIYIGPNFYYFCFI